MSVHKDVSEVRAEEAWGEEQRAREKARLCHSKNQQHRYRNQEKGGVVGQAPTHIQAPLLVKTMHGRKYEQLQQHENCSKEKYKKENYQGKQGCVHMRLGPHYRRTDIVALCLYVLHSNLPTDRPPLDSSCSLAHVPLVSTSPFHV